MDQWWISSGLGSELRYISGLVLAQSGPEGAFDYARRVHALLLGFLQPNSLATTTRPYGSRKPWIGTAETLYI